MNTQTIEDIAQAEQGTSLWKDAWLRLRKNHLAVFGLVTLVLFIVIAILAGIILVGIIVFLTQKGKKKTS